MLLFYVMFIQFVILLTFNKVSNKGQKIMGLVSVIATLTLLFTTLSIIMTNPYLEGLNKNLMLFVLIANIVYISYSFRLIWTVFKS